MALTVPTFAGVLLGTGSTVVYQVPNVAGNWVKIDGLYICNTSPSASVTFVLYRTPTAGTAGDAQTLFDNVLLAPGQTLTSDTVITLAQNEALRGLASTASLISVNPSGMGNI